MVTDPDDVRLPHRPPDPRLHVGADQRGYQRVIHYAQNNFLHVIHGSTAARVRRTRAYDDQRVAVVSHAKALRFRWIVEIVR